MRCGCQRVNNMHELENVKNMIYEAFANVEYPGDWCLRGSNEGEEPYLLEKEFKGRTDWRNIDAVFLDQALRNFWLEKAEEKPEN